MAEGGTATIGALELQIQSDASKAAGGLTRLANSLSSLKTAITSVDLDKLGNQLKRFVFQLNQASGDYFSAPMDRMIDGFNRLAAASKQLEGVKGMIGKVFDAASGSNAKSAARSLNDVASGVGAGIAGTANPANTASEALTSAIAEAKVKQEELAEGLQAGSTAVGETAKETGNVTSGLRDSARAAADAAKSVKEVADAMKEAKRVGPVEITTDTRPHLAGRGSNPELDALREEMNARRELNAMSKVDRTGFVPAHEKLGMGFRDAKEGADSLRTAMGGIKTETEGAVRASEALKDGMGMAKAHTEELKPSVAGAKEEVSELGDKAEEAGDKASAIQVLGAAFKGLKNAIFGAKGGILGFMTQLVRVAKYRLFRSLIRSITQGFSEGLKNLREYSKAVNNLYNKDMTNLENSTFKMKNSLGAALGSALQSLIPILQTLSHWVIEASNALNQFFALISGRTSWTRAVDAVASDFEKTKNSASGAAKEAKNLLASWDELNIIQSQSGNGGPGSGSDINGDYANLFEEVYEFDERIQNLAKTFGIIKDNALEIGIALAAWKIGTSLVSSLLTVSPLLAAINGSVIGAAMAFIVVALDYKFMTSYLESGNPTDLTAANVTTAAGAALAAFLVGKGFSKTMVGGASAGMAAAGIAFGSILTATGLVDMVLAFGDMDTKGITKENLSVLASGAVKTALGIGTLASSIMSLLSRAGIYKGKFGIQQGAGIFVMAAAITAGVAVDVTLTKGALQEGEDGDFTKIAESILTEGASAALAGIGGFIFGGKEYAAKGAGAALTITAVADLTLGIRDMIDKGATQNNILTMVKGAVGLGVGTSLLAHGGLLGKLASGLGFTSKSLGVTTFFLAAEVALSAYLNSEALKEGSMADVLKAKVSDALTSAALGIGVAKATDSAKTGAATVGIALAISGSINIAATLKDIKAEGFTEANTASLITNALETALGTGISVGVMTGNAILGVVAGVLTLAVTGIATYFTAQAREISLAAGGSKLKLTDAEIGAAVETYYDKDITIGLNVTHTKITELAAARAEVTSAILNLQGQYTIWVQTGLKKLEGEELEKFCAEVGAIVESINKALTAEQSVIELSLGMYAHTDEEKTILTGLSASVADRQKFIKSIGEEIGKYLAEGTIAEYQEVVPELLSVLSEVAGIEAQSKARAKFSTTASKARSEFERSGLSNESFENYVKAYTDARKEAISGIEEGVEAEYAIALEALDYYNLYKASPEEFNKRGIRYDNIDELIALAQSRVAWYETNRDQIIQDRLSQVAGQDEQAFIAAIVSSVASMASKSEPRRSGEGSYSAIMRMTGLSDATVTALGGFVNMDWLADVISELQTSAGGKVDTSGYVQRGNYAYKVRRGVNENVTPFGVSEMPAYVTEADVLKELAKSMGLKDGEYAILGLGGGNAALKTSKGEYSFNEQMLEAFGYTFGGILDELKSGNAQEMLQWLLEGYGLAGTPLVFAGGGTVTMESPNAEASTFDAVAEIVQQGGTVTFSGAVGAPELTPLSPPGAPGFESEEDVGKASEEKQMEQISLMQSMLNLVNQILNKEFNARLVPSVATGRAVIESERLYENTMGVY